MLAVLSKNIPKNDLDIKHFLMSVSVEYFYRHEEHQRRGESHELSFSPNVPVCVNEIRSSEIVNIQVNIVRMCECRYFVSLKFFHTNNDKLIKSNRSA